MQFRMKKYYLFTPLLLALIFGTFSSVSAQDDSRNTSVDVNVDASARTRVLQVEAQAKTRADLEVNYEAQKARVEAQRAKMKAEAEARKTAAEARGDEMQAKREAMRIEFEAKRAEMDASRERLRAEFEVKRTEARARITEFREDIAKRRVENATRVIMATIERLEKIITRIESRIAKIEARGGVTVESKNFVSAAKGNLADARAALAIFASIDLSGETAESNFERIRTAAAEAREHIRAAHQNLMLAIRALSSVEVDLESDSEVQGSTE
jgi:hypothetical protein